MYAHAERHAVHVPNQSYVSMNYSAWFLWALLRSLRLACTDEIIFGSLETSYVHRDCIDLSFARHQD